MQSTLIPSNCCKEIERTVRKFIWGQSNDHRGISLVKWKELCQPLKHGGCGFFRLESQNKAFISKLIFKLFSQPDSLWVQVLKGKYGFIDTITLNDTPCSNPSHFWRNILKSLQDTSFHVKWKIGDGKKLRFWSDYWVGDHSPLRHISFAPLSEADLSNPISHYTDADGRWQWHLFDKLLPPDVLQSISEISISQPPESPSCFWSLTPNCNFTTKSAYLTYESLSWDTADSKWARVWKLPVAQRIRTFTWLLLKGKLLTNSERFKRGMSSDCHCTLCNRTSEDVDHIFKTYPIASSV